MRRLLRQPAYARNFSERLGLLPAAFNQPATGCIWLHAVSVGEVTSLVPLLKVLGEQLPGVPLYLSTSTIAGRQAAERQAQSLVNGIFYLPLDFESAVRRALNTLRPVLLVVVETEIWPNLFALAKETGASLAIINGRISDRAWPAYNQSRGLFSPVLGLPDLVQVQSETDAQRYTRLGVPPSRLRVEANLKYDASLSAPANRIATYGASSIWIAASTVGPNERGSLHRHQVDEDEIVLDAFGTLKNEVPGLLLILAPRQPSRFTVVAEKLVARGLSFTRRSQQAEHLRLPGVLLLDTIGELASLYALANVVFVGGSLAPRGGHNIVEPAAAGAPILVGPHMQNFAAIARDFRAAEAIQQLATPAELTTAVRVLLQEPARAELLSARARQVLGERRGASARTADRLLSLYHAGTFHRLAPLSIRITLAGLAALWTLGGYYKRLRAERQAGSLAPISIPVISVGGLSIGGSGKTPFTIALASELSQLGYRCGILTRGYKRQSKGTLLFPSGSRVSALETGDEAQLLLRANIGPVGIGANRYETACVLLQRFPGVKLLLLDDGFQHARLPRLVDIVLLDGLDPFSNGAVVPAGRLREPSHALSRATAVVITRCPSDARFEAIANQVHTITPAPVFRTETLPGKWHDARTGRPVTFFPSGPVAAFCGLGNPQSFQQTLQSLGLPVAWHKTYPDHHRYRASDLRHLAARASESGVTALLTTEKDYFNLPPGVDQFVSVPVLYLPIRMALTDPAPFLELLDEIVAG